MALMSNRSWLVNKLTSFMSEMKCFCALWLRVIYCYIILSDSLCGMHLESLIAPAHSCWCDMYNLFLLPLVTTQCYVWTQVNDKVVVAACVLHDVALIEMSHSKQLCWAANKLKLVSGINSEDWDTMKMATALKIMFAPVEATDDDMEVMFRKFLTFY